MQEQTLKAVIGMYPTRTGVEIAVEAFRDAGFKAANISVILPQRMTCNPAPGERRSTVAGIQTDDVEVVAADPQTPVSGEASILVAGPIGEGLDATEECAPADLVAALISLGVPENETEEYTDRVLQGKALLTVHCDTPEAAVAARRLHGDLGGMDVLVTREAEPVSDRPARSMVSSVGK